MLKRRPFSPKPMQALLVEMLPESDWLYEIKFDGYRALAFKDGKDVRLVSRNRNEFDYSQLLDALNLLPAKRVILDAEIAALDEKGRSSFQLLQLFKSPGDVPLVYYVFDLLFLEGKDLCKQPLTARRKLLATFSRNLLNISGSLTSSAALKRICSVSPRSSALRGWSPRNRIHSTKAAAAAAPGSN
jgi:bifunctional non-homologous end joining protein LigD